MSVLSLQDMIAECYLSLQRSATNKKSLLLALLGLVAAQGESLTCFSELLFKQGAGSTFDTLSICPTVSLDSPIYHCPITADFANLLGPLVDVSLNRLSSSRRLMCSKTVDSPGATQANTCRIQLYKVDLYSFLLQRPAFYAARASPSI